MTRFPNAVEDLTPELLTSVLSDFHPGAVVEAFAVAETSVCGDGLASTADRVKLELHYAEGNDAELPSTLLLKTMLWKPHAPQAMYHNEVRFYREVRPELSIEAPRVYGSLFDEETGQFVIRSYLGAADNQLKARLFRLDRHIASEAIRARTAVLSRDLGDDPSQPELRAAARSAAAAPLVREGHVIGSIAIYDHVAADRFEVGSFDEDDLELFRKFHAVVEQAIANAIFHAEAREQQGFDAETGLANADAFAGGVHEEIVRATAGGDPLALVICRIENLEAIEDASGRIGGRRVARRTAEALRAHLREFDLPCRLARGEFGVLLPDPGEAPVDRLVALARAVADDVSKDDALNDPVRIDLAFGYALFPDDGRDRETLLSHARIARIQIV